MNTLTDRIHNSADNFRSNLTLGNKIKLGLLAVATGVTVPFVVAEATSHNNDAMPCTLATVENGGTPIGAVKAAVRELGYDPDNTGQAVYAGQMAASFIERDNGNVYAGDSFITCSDGSNIMVRPVIEQ